MAMTMSGGSANSAMEEVLMSATATKALTAANKAESGESLSAEAHALTPTPAPAEDAESRPSLFDLIDVIEKDLEGGAIPHQHSPPHLSQQKHQQLQPQPHLQQPQQQLQQQHHQLSHVLPICHYPHPHPNLAHQHHPPLAYYSYTAPVSLPHQLPYLPSQPHHQQQLYQLHKHQHLHHPYFIRPPHPPLSSIQAQRSFILPDSASTAADSILKCSAITVFPADRRPPRKSKCEGETSLNHNNAKAAHLSGEEAIESEANSASQTSESVLSSISPPAKSSEIDPRTSQTQSPSPLPKLPLQSNIRAEQIQAQLQPLVVTSSKIEIKQYRRYKCEYPGCNKAFAASAGLRCHNLTHTGEKPFKCTLCSKAYTTNNRLKVHMRDHTNDKPYACDFPGCSYRTKQKCSLTPHRLSHLGAKEKHIAQMVQQRTMECKLCGKFYKNETSLDQHSWTEHRQAPVLGRVSIGGGESGSMSADVSENGSENG
ncbi:hypothetical protein HK100_007150, partial [Physocladia obscura]